jgi:DNA repair photolyase
MLFETVGLTQSAVEICVQNNIPVKILTKKVDYIVPFLCYSISVKWNNIAFGFTLTGHNEIEPNASTNIERMLAMQKLCNAGFKTFASIEPIIDLGDSLNCIYRVEPVCDLFKIGVLSGKLYNRQELKEFIHNIVDRGKSKYYFKDSLLKAAGINRSELPDNCVTKDYNIFNKQL